MWSQGHTDILERIVLFEGTYQRNGQYNRRSYKYEFCLSDESGSRKQVAQYPKAQRCVSEICQLTKPGTIMPIHSYFRGQTFFHFLVDLIYK